MHTYIQSYVHVCTLLCLAGTLSEEVQDKLYNCWVVEVCGCVSEPENGPVGRGGVREPESGPVGCGGVWVCSEPESGPVGRGGVWVRE